MIRYKEIFLGKQCNNRCLYCLLRQKDSSKPDFNTLISALQQSEVNPPSPPFTKGGMGGLTGKQDSVAFYGGEPTFRDDLLDIILAAKRNGYRRIKLLTNGRAFSDIQVLLQIVNAGSYLFEIKLWGSNPALHDYLTQTKDSFWQTIQGLENLQRLSCDKFICVRIPICKQNYKDIENTVATAMGFGINRIVLSFQDHKLAFKDLLHHIKNAINISILNRIWILTEGLPFCIMQGLEHHIGEIYYGYDTIHDKTYRHNKYCQDCIYQEICPGVEIRYLNQFGDREFSPVKAGKYFQDIKALYG